MAWKNYPGAVLATLLVTHILAQIDRNILLGFSSTVVAELGISNAQYGLLVGAVWVLSYAVMAIVMGACADRFSRTRVIAAGLVVWSVCTAASGSTHSFGQLVAARLLVATGEAALVPAAVGILAEVFSARRRATALGLFFIGIPLGVGSSFVLAGTVGAVYGWRATFHGLGVIGAVMAVALAFLKDEREQHAAAARSTPFAAQLREVLCVMRGSPALQLAITGFVLVHLIFAGLSFAQLWLVRERGLDPAGITRLIGGAQILFGTLGAVVGGAGGDRFARRFAGGHASFMALLVAVCAPLMIAYRFAPAGSPLFYAGMCAGAFLPLAVYGPAISVIQSHVPTRMRSTITGLTMTLINLFAFALGNFAAGALSDRLAKAGVHAPLTWVLLGTDLFAIASLPCFLALARHARSRAAPGDTAPERACVGASQQQAQN
ncbi:MFS transporter [Paraburkholderia oxyphila]|uniref:MFS transporter n=1 Tax=Paraburkholderia oxyphila TaxID=614212 RepID=UPI0005B8E090|nr:MFS transporter [Paraburkholderia oxyphila]